MGKNSAQVDKNPENVGKNSAHVGKYAVLVGKNFTAAMKSQPDLRGVRFGGCAFCFGSGQL